MNQKIVSLASAGGVAFNQLKDGSIRVYINPTNAERFKNELLRLAGEINRYLIDEAERAKASETAQYVLPKTRIEQLEDELSRLRAADLGTLPVPGLPVSVSYPPPAIPFDEDAARANTIVSGGFGG